MKAAALEALVSIDAFKPCGTITDAAVPPARAPRSRPKVSLKGAGSRTREPEAPWLSECISDERGRVISNLANVLIAFRSAPELADLFAYDAMLCAPVLMRGLPTAPGAHVEVNECELFPRPVRDTDVSRVQEYLQHLGIRKVGREMTHQAVDQRAEEQTFHPVRAYLNNLVWDGETRLNTWIADYLGAEPTSYATGIGRMFLVALVARIYQPGCKADYMLVLEGKQGAGKSRVCRILAGDWFSDSLPNIHDKDAAQHIRGKWLIEVAELAAFKRPEAEALKAFVTRAEERYRPAYGRKEVVEKRQCLFVGTTNKEAYLSDETGARRFWPVKVGAIDIPGLEQARDQLFAEAVAAYRKGEQWWPDQRFELAHIKPEQETRYEADPWEETIAGYIAPLSRVNVTQIARDALSIETAKTGRADQNRIIAVLTSKGWKSGRDSHGRFYTAPASGESRG